MIALRKFIPEDAPLVCKEIYPGLPLVQVLDLIAQWDTCQYNGKVFLMMGVWADQVLVGTISLYEQSGGQVSLGIEISEKHRRKGYAAAAVTLVMEYAQERGYHTVVSQVRQDNIASIALHQKLGFQLISEGNNAKGTPVFWYQNEI